MIQSAKNGAASVESLVAHAADDFAEALARGERPHVDAFAAHYPEIADQLRRILPAIEAMQSLSADGDAAEVLSDLPAAARELGDFRLIREIGRGGMGVVYEAEQLSLGRTVALKILPFAAMLDARQLARFRNEARAAATLHHNNIVPVHFIGSESGVHFYAMQLIKGESLARVIEQLRRESGLSDEDSNSAPDLSHDIHASLPTGSVLLTLRREDEASRRSVMPTMDEPTTDFRPPFESIPPQATGLTPPEPRATHHAPRSTLADVHALLSTARSTSNKTYFRNIAELGIQAAEALDYAHEQGVIHRDIKPANLLLEDTGRLWITDFGLARLETDAGMTMTGDLVGTLRYMSPEQTLGKRVVVDHRTDIYSLGATLYEMLTLHPIFRGEDREDLLRQIACEEPLPPRKLNRQIPVELETIVLKALRKNANERYATAKELAEDLRSFLDNRPINAKPPTRRDRLVKWSQRHPATLLSTSMIAAILALVLSVAAIIINAAKNDERQSRARADRQSELALNTLKLVVDHIQSKLDNVPGTFEIRRSLLNTAIDGLRDVARNLETASVVDEKLFESHLALGRIFLTTYSSSSGSAIDDARTEFQLAREIATKLAHDDPANRQAQFELMAAYDGLAGVAFKALDLETQLDARKKENEIAVTLAQSAPGDATVQEKLASSYLRLADARSTNGDMASAREASQLAIQAFARISKNPDSDSNLMAAQAQLARIDAAAGDLAGGRKGLKKALEIGKRIAETGRDDSRSQRTLAAVYQQLSIVNSALGDHSAARNASKNDLEIAQKLADMDPHNAAVQLDLAQAYEACGDCERNANDFSSAGDAYERSLKIRLAQRDPHHALAERDLCLLLYRLKLVYQHLRNRSAEADAGQKTLKVALEAAENNPRNPLFKTFVAVSYWELGKTELADRAAQRDLYQKSLDILRKLLQDNPENIGTKETLAAVYGDLGQNLLDSGSTAAACDLFREFCRLMPEDYRAHESLGAALATLATKTGDERTWDETAVEFLHAIDLAEDNSNFSSPRKDACFKLATWAEAFNRAVRLRPNEGVLWIGRAQHRALCKQWHEAADDYARALGDAKHSIRLGDDTNAEYAGCLILDHNEEEYQQFRQELKARLTRQSNDESAAYVVSRVYAMGSVEPADASHVVKWAKQATRAKPVPDWIVHTLGLAQYRAGQFDGAIDNLRRASAGDWGGRASDLFLLAVIHDRLGHKDEARRCLNEAAQLLKAVGPDPNGSECGARIPCPDWIELNVLSREAEKLFGTALYERASSAPPKDASSSDARKRNN